MYVIGVAGVAGISLEGEDLLRHIAVESGGRAFFPFREEQLPDVHAQIAADVQIRYVLTYTPKNQKVDGTWRAITVKTDDPTHTIKVRKGYTAPLPPPIKPSIELTIRDANRQFVDVTAEDLVVLEDGVEQKVEVFQEAVAPVSIILVLDESGSMKRAAPMVMEVGARVRAVAARQGQTRGHALLGPDRARPRLDDDPGLGARRDQAVLGQRRHRAVRRHRRGLAAVDRAWRGGAPWWCSPTAATRTTPARVPAACTRSRTC